MFYVNEKNIPCRELSFKQNDSNFEIIFLEITLRNCKWLLISLYEPPGQNKNKAKKTRKSQLNFE